MSSNDSAITSENAAKQASDAGSASRTSPSLADLPAPLRDAIAAVCKRARLWKHERADVEAELAAHFHDGLAQGTAPDTLLANFGDIKAAAKLIRRGKIRNRPLWWQLQRRIGQAIAAMLLVLVAFVAVHTVRFYIGTPTIAFRPVDELNREAHALAEADRAWPLYRKAVLGLDLTRAEVERLGTATWSDPAVLPGALAQAEAVLSRNAASIELIHRGASKQGLGIVVGIDNDAELDAKSTMLLGYPPSIPPGTPAAAEAFPPDAQNPEAFLILLPHLPHIRIAARLLRDDALVGASKGDGARVHRDLVSILSIARQNRSPDTLISCLVSVAVVRLVTDLTMDVLEHAPAILSDEQLTDLAHRLAALGGPADLISLQGERIGYRDAIQRLYTDDGQGDGRLTAAGVEYYNKLAMVTQNRESQIAVALASPLVAGRREMTNAFESLFARAEAGLRRPLWKSSEPSADRYFLELTEGKLTTIRYALISILAPAFERTRVKALEAVAQRDAVLVALAAESFRRAQGTYPETLDSLVPRFLPEIPADPVDGMPLRYRRTANSFILYSIGADRRDDAGRFPSTDADASRVRNIDHRGTFDAPCDLIYFPRRANPVAGAN
ncbi:MAG: hypothetical protein K2Y21_12615 [Phycisphaerales bacterium]|nr:hypothetical protein [Phycisphaerales bacterium]